jgi:paraquat-inducible protein A
VRCGTVLAVSRGQSIAQALALAITATILMFMACFFPFLTLNVGGGSNQASLFDAIIAFSDAAQFPVAISVAALIIILPTVRLILLIYVLGPLVMGRTPLPRAMPVFRITEQLRPWCMVEIFVVGVAVSLVKIVGMADVDLGPAFWAITILVPVTVWKDSILCKWTLWSVLQKA